MLKKSKDRCQISSKNMSKQPTNVNSNSNNNQNCSNAFSGCLSSVLPAIIAAFTSPINVSATISSFTLLSASALNTSHPKAPNEPPPCSISTFSRQLIVDIYIYYY